VGTTREIRFFYPYGLLLEKEIEGRIEKERPPTTAENDPTIKEEKEN